jgi:serine/threonine protein kinase
MSISSKKNNQAMSSGKSSNKNFSDPAPGEAIQLFGERYTVQPHPGAPHMAFCAEAGRAHVYQLRNFKGEPFAFKVFKSKFRTPNLVNATQNLKKFEHFPGLRAAKRQIVLPSDPASRTYRNLEYAVLMHWIEGRTWFDVLGIARNNGFSISRSTAILLCNNLLTVIEGLERDNIAHTDISPGNVVVDLNTYNVELLDLEDMYIPGAEPPPFLNIGSTGYRHYTGDQGVTCWRPEGDRYAAAVLAAEILILSDRGLVNSMTDDGFFTTHCKNHQGALRYNKAERLLKSIAPDFASVFDRTWRAASLQECPRISELREGVRDLAGQLIASPHPPSPPSNPGVRWEPLYGDKPAKSPRGYAPAPPRPTRDETIAAWEALFEPSKTSQPVRSSSSGRPIAQWGEAATPSRKPQGGSPDSYAGWIAFIIIVVVLLLILIIASLE